MSSDESDESSYSTDESNSRLWVTMGSYFEESDDDSDETEGSASCPVPLQHQEEDYGVAAYATEAANCIHENPSIIYHPTNSIRNFILLNLLRQHISLKSSRRILILAPSEHEAMHHLLFLRRHILNISKGSWSDYFHYESLPLITVSKICSLPHILNNIDDIDLGLVIFLECHSAMQDESVVKFMTHLKEKKTVSSCDTQTYPTIHCFTSCIVTDTFVPEKINEMQDFYGCKLISISDRSILERIIPVATQNIHSYEKLDCFSDICVDALKILDNAKTLCENFEFKMNSNFTQVFNTTSHCFIQDTLNEIKVQLAELGEYGGSVAALAAFRHFVRLYTFADSTSGHTTKHMLGYILCCLSKFRKVLEDNMLKVECCKRIELFSSDKIKSLLKFLRDLPAQNRALIIVKNPHTASILTLVLQKIRESEKTYSNIKTELIINGSSSPESESWGDILSWERNMEVYSRFVAGETNILVLSGELQSIDLPSADLVLLLDDIGKYSSFLLAKNQTKFRTGKLILFTEKSNQVTYEKKINMYQKMVEDMKEALIRKETLDHTPTTCMKKFKTDFGLKISAEEAVDLITRYCNSMHCGKFTHHPLLWKIEIKKEGEGPDLYTAFLVLPRVLGVQMIQSKARKSWQAAHQGAALKAVKELYRIRELTDEIISTLQASPDSSKSPYLPVSLSPFLSPFSPKHYIEGKTGSELEGELSAYLPTLESSLIEDKDILCDLMYPASLTAAQPKPGTETYVHIIKIWPVSEPPSQGDNRKTALYELLCEKKFFAILSCRPLQKVCQFPVFAFGHELTVELETSTKILNLTKDELLRLRKFHIGLFVNVLPIVQCFMQYDVWNKENSYIIAPLTIDGSIDWNVVDNNTFIPECRELTKKEKASLVCTEESYEKTMVKPWYRHLLRDQVYLVATVCTDMDAESCFPTEDFDSFLDYYKEKYNITLDRPELPLLEVYLINTKINCLLPRPRTVKARREEKMEEFREHMVPELCVPLIFPAALWLKLSCLPSILHRLNRLLIAEELHSLIQHEAGLEVTGENWSRMTVDLSCVKDSCAYSSVVPPSTVKRGLAIGNVKLEDRKKIARLRKPWQLTQEPVDVYRHLESLNLVEIRYLDEFLVKSMSNQSPNSSKLVRALSSLSITSEDSDTSELDFASESKENDSKTVVVPQEISTIPISLLKPEVKSHGPQQYELLEVLTSSYSNDSMNMDRLQVLGNAFLNLTITVYTFKYCLKNSKSSTIQSLYQLRKTFLDKSYLANCSINSKLCDRIKALDFTPGEWIPPSFTTPLMLKQVLKEQEINPNVLQNISLSKEEQITGIIDPSSEDDILEVLLGANVSSTAKRDEIYIDRQYVPIQTASSCVESLVGVYFKNCGWQGALKVVGWLQLLPLKNLSHLLDYKEIPEYMIEDSEIDQLPIYLGTLELSLSHNFKNKMLLAQAVIHESYKKHASLGSMGSLAYLGSGILDFLLTCFMYENFTELTPSQLWRLREILSSTPLLASIAVQHDFHMYLLSSSPSLLSAIDRFVRYQNSCQQPYGDEVQLLLEEHECNCALQVEVPNALAKLLPSLVGAIYLDSGRNLSIVWSCIQNIFLPQLSIWRKDVPLSVIKLLEELSPAAHQVIFSNKTGGNGTVQVTCKVLMDNTREEVFVAQGHDLAKTKTHAAKLALRSLLGFTFTSY